MILKYRKKPVIIEALQIQKIISEEMMIEINNFCPKACLCVFNENVYFIINTLEGQMKAELGDWIIKGIEGEFYPCKPDIFKKTYEIVKKNKKTRRKK